MLRSRSVSSRSVLRSVVSTTVVVVSLFFASRASAGTPVVVAGPEGSARVTAIVSELRTRGFDVTTDPSQAGSAHATVRVAADGSVDVVAGRLHETLPASDGDAILSRRVAETIRAADADADAADAQGASLPPPPPPPPPEPAKAPAVPEPPRPAPPSQPATPPSSPSRAFAQQGTWRVSIDDALPLVAIGGAAPLSTDRMLRVGDPAYGARTSPKPIAVDVAVADRLTLGGTLLAQYGLTSSILGGALRVGYAIPIGDRLVLWPRIGVAHESTLDDGSWQQLSRTDVIGEARLVWTVTRSWALTLGPSIALAVQTKRHQAQPASSTVFPGPVPTYPENAPTRISVAIGITGRLSREPGEENEAEQSAGQARFFLGIARALPLLRYRVDTAITDQSRKGREAEGPPARADAGTVDATSISPQAPVLSLDVRVGQHLTVGAGGSIGVVRFTQAADQLVPTASAPTLVSWTISPRVGWRNVESRSFAFWPRVGLSYVHASSGQLLAYQLGVDADAFAVFSPIPGVGLLFGPSVELPIAGVRTIENPTTSTTADLTKRQDQAVVTVALTGGLVVELP